MEGSELNQATMPARFSLKLHLWIVLCLTAIMVIVVQVFSFKVNLDFVRHPQFGYFNQFDDIDDHIHATAPVWFGLYFVIDFIWAAMLLWLIVRFIQSLQILYFNRLFILLIILSVLAYAFDAIENLNYLTRGNLLREIISFKTIVNLKVLFYALVIVLALIAVYLKYVASLIIEIWRSIKVSALSILCIGLLMILSTFMDQGTTVIIHLLEHPGSLALSIFAINILALACAHYPDYFYKYFYPKPDVTIEWKMSKVFLTAQTGLGLINYKEESFEDGNQVSAETLKQRPRQEAEFFDAFRKVLGGFLLITWLYVLLFVMAKYMWPALPVGQILVLLVVVYLVFNNRMAQTKQYWKRHFNNNIFEKYLREHPGEPVKINLTENDFPKPIPFWLKLTLLSFILTIAVYIIAILCAVNCAWSLTWWWLVAAGLLNGLYFILFQNFRTLLRIYPFSRGWKWIPLLLLSNDFKYVGLFAGTGFVMLVSFVAFSFDPVRLNALVFILMFLYLVYGLLVVTIKHILYYKSHQHDDPKPHPYRYAERVFIYYIPVIVVIFLGLILYSSRAGNGLHGLTAAKEENLKIDFDAYANKLKDNLRQDTASQAMFVASYGGGLRAAAWTMLLLDNLNNRDPGFLNSTVAMSGASGGFLGLSFFLAALTETEDSENVRSTIDTIGNHNMLGIDVAYLLGFDFIRELLPYIDTLGKDRAMRSMKEYSKLIQPDEVRNENLFCSSYRNYWEYGYNKAGYLPALIGNTTSTHSRYGVALSLKPEGYELLFPGADDILDLDSNNSISYLSATSTTERFPIFSPAAQIKGKGYYVDGGYFENSGLLSLVTFHDFINRPEFGLLREGKVRVILIINSKESYIRYVLGNKLMTPDRDLSSSEVSAILHTVTDIDILPLALEERYRHQFKTNFIPVYLPYPITFQDVEDVIGASPLYPFEVMDRIRVSNQKIKTALENAGYQGVAVPPALARVLSNPAYEYMKAMMKHPEIDSVFREIVKKN